MIRAKGQDKDVHHKARPNEEKGLQTCRNAQAQHHLLHGPFKFQREKVAGFFGRTRAADHDVSKTGANHAAKQRRKARADDAQFEHIDAKGVDDKNGGVHHNRSHHGLSGTSNAAQNLRGVGVKSVKRIGKAGDQQVAAGDRLHLRIGARERHGDNGAGEEHHHRRHHKGDENGRAVRLFDDARNAVFIRSAGILCCHDRAAHADGDNGEADKLIDLIDNRNTRHRALTQRADDHRVDDGQQRDKKLVDEHGNEHAENCLPIECDVLIE